MSGASLTEWISKIKTGCRKKKLGLSNSEFSKYGNNFVAIIQVKQETNLFGLYLFVVILFPHCLK
jgi:hypothetical protein